MEEVSHVARGVLPSGAAPLLVRMMPVVCDPLKASKLDHCTVKSLMPGPPAVPTIGSVIPALNSGARICEVVGTGVVIYPKFPGNGDWAGNPTPAVLNPVKRIE